MQFSRMLNFKNYIGQMHYFLPFTLKNRVGTDYGTLCKISDRSDFIYYVISQFLQCV